MSDEMIAVRIEEIYQEILDGERKKFPSGTWSEDVNNELAKRVTRYLIESVLLWDIQDIRKGWTEKFIKKMKLTTVLAKYNSSPYKMLNDAYPGLLKEWELKMSPLNFWTKEKGLEALKWTIEEKEQLTEKEILEVYSGKWIAEHKLASPCHMFFKGSPYMMINSLYLGKFKEWQFQCAPNQFWTKENGLEALRWIIEEEEQLSEEQLLQIYSQRWIKEKNLSGLCQKFWRNSPYAMLNELYPNRFKEWELPTTSNGFWTEENSLEALRWTIEEKEQLSEEHLKEVYSHRWVNKHKLSVPLNKFWGNNPFNMLNSLYPGRFKRWEFSVSPYNFWTKKNALEALKWTIEEKEKLSEEALLQIYTGKWIKQQRLQYPLDTFWGGSPYAMLNELYPNQFSKEMLKGYKHKGIGNIQPS
ncbi:DUF4046 domain-containing protein [Bacillus sp. IT-79MI2]|uniref:DUF4046 domain-containing protein n=1 Tax=Bacillus sp. IT-79MI2 TaxID=3026438 RepID=UPI0039E1F798